MGRAKAALSLGSETFVGRLVRVLGEAGIEAIVVVAGPDRAATVEALGNVEAELVETAFPERGPIGSIVTGMKALGPERTREGLLIAPVDHPAIRRSTLTRILTSGHQRDRAVVVPTYRGKRGHPTWFSPGILDELRDPALEGGARAVVRANPARVAEVPVEDPGIVANIDTPAAYTALTRQFPDGL